MKHYSLEFNKPKDAAPRVLYYLLITYGLNLLSLSRLPLCI